MWFKCVKKIYGYSNMKIAMCMFYDEPISHYASITEDINKLYCGKHMIDMVVSQEPVYENRHSAWESVPLVLKQIETNNYDYVIWIDADAFFYHDSPNITSLIYENSSYDFIFSWDYPGSSQHHTKEINTGVYVVKNTTFAKEFLKKWAYDENLFNNSTMKYRWDQGVLNDMVRQNILDISSHIKVEDYGVMQHFFKEELANLSKSPWVYHMAGRRAAKKEHERYDDASAYFEQLSAT